MKWLKWSGGLLAIVMVAAVALMFFSFKYFDQNYRSDAAINDAISLARACELYCTRNPERKFPEKLGDLIHPPFADESFIENPASGLIDPWGNPFKYALVRNEKGEWEPYVWAERTVDGKTTLLGAKGTAGGETILFGLPD